MRKISKADRKGVPVPVLEIIEGTIQVATLLGPALDKAFDAINDFIASLGAKNPNSPKNVRLRLAAVETREDLQKQKNKEYDRRLADLEQRLQEQEELEIVPENTNSTAGTPAPVHEAAGKVLYYNTTTGERQALKPTDKKGISDLVSKGFKRINLSYWNTLTAAAKNTQPAA